MPGCFSSFEGALLGGMQKILYVSDATSKPGAGDIILPPPAKLLQMVRSQYVTTLYKVLSGMVESAEKSLKKSDDDWTTEADGFVVVNNPLGARDSLAGGVTINSADKVRCPSIPQTAKKLKYEPTSVDRMSVSS